MITSWTLLLTVMTGTLLIASPTTADYNALITDKVKAPPEPIIFGGYKYFLEGETFSMNCTVETQRNFPVALSWTIPGPFSKVLNESNEYAVRFDYPILYNNYTIKNANKEDEGEYTCTSKNSMSLIPKTFVKTYLDQPFINMNISNTNNPLEVTAKLIQLVIYVESYPVSDIRLLRNNEEFTSDKLNFNITVDPTNICVYRIRFLLRRLVVEDTANYVVVAKNKYITKNLPINLRVPGPPKIDFESATDKKYVQGTVTTLVCNAIGFPVPDITWVFTTEDGKKVVFNKKIHNNQMDQALSLYEMRSYLKLEARVSGDVECLANNSRGNKSVSREFLVYEMTDGFGIKSENKTWYSQGDNVLMDCVASKYDFDDIKWLGPDDVEVENVEYSTNNLSHSKILRMNNVSPEKSGTYTCVGRKMHGSDVRESISITVAATKTLEIEDFGDVTEEVLPYHPVNFTCIADAVPPPDISWFKDGQLITNDSNIEINSYELNHTTLYSIVKIAQMHEEDVGKYECRATSLDSIESKFYNALIKEKATHKATYLTVIGVIFFVLIVLVVYLAWKIRKEKQFRKELAAAGLLNFKEGVTKSINPELGIDEQAELLPYDEKFEFPSEKLILGKQLGAGAFGVVYKAEARGIVNAEETTTVAVKMVKKTADNMYIKALASELKILVHLGKHVNIVNLLGACTKNVGKRELIVIVEYCKYGNIHNYMQKHREVFIDQLTDNPEKNLGRVNRGYSCSSGNSGLMQSDYFGSNHTQETDHTFLNTANTNRSGRKDNNQKQVEFVKVSETGYVQPEWRSNYESDYSFDGRSPRPLASRDLLAWAFQIARGMEYLANRKVLHGDLAARNVLLTDDNIVKICDFGLAKSIYKNDEYQKQENSPLPVKWLAIECMTDRIFSTQSDVWSFGIVLWELFSLAKTPYPNVSPPSLLQWLSEGKRLEKPSYADDKLYDVMLQCWEQKPTSRPSFSQLQQILGSFLEDNVRNHYVDLNAVYIDMNTKKEGEEDYLAMVCAPDYNNLVTPSPHHYVNDARSFFPATPNQLQHDDEGYLQMSPATRQTLFNARAQSNKFDFDARKLTPRATEANTYGSELTPMLTLNNLPRSGSESDHEGNASPYLNMCPRIEEETDEVFETKQNNNKNALPSAVTNPTYITFSPDDEKKLQNFTNSYMNIIVPNGLVK